jgi:hypothetical protein
MKRTLETSERVSEELTIEQEKNRSFDKDDEDSCDQTCNNNCDCDKCEHARVLSEKEKERVCKAEYYKKFGGGICRELKTTKKEFVENLWIMEMRIEELANKHYNKLAFAEWVNTILTLYIKHGRGKSITEFIDDDACAMFFTGRKTTKTTMDLWVHRRNRFLNNYNDTEIVCQCDTCTRAVNKAQHKPMYAKVMMQLVTTTRKIRNKCDGKKYSKTGSYQKRDSAKYQKTA